MGASKIGDSKASRMANFGIWNGRIVGKRWVKIEEGGCVFLCAGLGADIKDDEFNDRLEQTMGKSQG